MLNWIEKAGELNSLGQSFILVTVVRVSGSTPREPGAKMIVCSETKFWGTIGGGRLEQLAIKEACLRLESGESGLVRYPLGATTGQCCGGTAEVYFEACTAKGYLYLFGAGHVAQAVARSLLGTPFDIHVIDERAEWISRLPRGVQGHAVPFEEFINGAAWDSKKTYVAVMTHQHDIDQQILEQTLRRPFRYLGLIGSASKWSRFQQRLLMRGFTEADLKRVRCPFGLDIGEGKSPEEIAISLNAELLKEHYQKFSDVPVVILAAGKGSRAGGPKGLLSINGRPWLSLQIQTLRKLGFKSLIVVLGAEFESHLASVPELHQGGVQVVCNPNPEDGPFSSLQAGLRILINPLGCFVLPVDVPAPKADVWASLFEMIRIKQAAVPNHDFRRGHPAWLSFDLTRDLLRMDTLSSRLDYCLDSLRLVGKVADVPVADPSIELNLNFSESYAGLASSEETR